VTEPQTFELEIPAESRFLATARNFASDAARSAGWLDESQLDDVRLVVSEAVTNALRAQEHREVEDLIRVTSLVFEDRMEILVSDSAGGFEVPPDAPELPDPDPRRESGFGLPLIEALSDEAHFTRAGGGTVVRVVVYRLND
jgi:anti-sigma regulatory factor (Ser/Thr protein kinase)